MTVLPPKIRVDGGGKVDSNYQKWPTHSAGPTSATTTSRRSCRPPYGRMVVLDDRILFFANPEDAAEYIGFDLEQVS